MFDQFFKSSGPQIPLFSRFKLEWKNIDVAKYAAIGTPVPGVKSDLTSTEEASLCQMKMDCINFLQQQSIEGAQPRQDYLELINLSRIMLGKDIVGDDGSLTAVHFSPPGAS